MIQLAWLAKGDPRHYQIATLTSLLIYGIFWLDFEVQTTHAIAILVTAQITQYVCTRLSRLPHFDPKSALISSLSLCLLLRTNFLAVAVLAACISIAGKFFIRWNGKHVFNPTNFGLMAVILITGQAWVSPGQWGSDVFLGFLFACLGGLVVNRSSRSDVTYAFLGFYLAVVFGRSLWLGQPTSIPLHQLQSGALLLFAFFMISDPKTTPDSRAGRILFALLVALGAGLVHFVLFRPNGLLWSLVFFAMFVPFIDRLLPGNRYQWKRATPQRVFEKGETHETAVDIRGCRPGRGALAGVS
jgi:Na+-transporting NADH:ubiquinone oxidoreductase subunit NqrB